MFTTLYAGIGVKQTHTYARSLIFFYGVKTLYAQWSSDPVYCTFARTEKISDGWLVTVTNKPSSKMIFVMANAGKVVIDWGAIAGESDCCSVLVSGMLSSGMPTYLVMTNSQPTKCVTLTGRSGMSCVRVETMRDDVLITIEAGMTVVGSEGTESVSAMAAIVGNVDVNKGIIVGGMGYPDGGTHSSTTDGACAVNGNVQINYGEICGGNGRWYGQGASAVSGSVLENYGMLYDGAWGGGLE